MNKKKKKVIFISSIVGVLLVVGTILFFVGNKGEAKKTSSAPNHQVVKSRKKVSSYKGIQNLSYKVKRNDIVDLGNGSVGLIFDIVSAPIPNENLSALEQKVYELASKDSGKNIKNVVIHIIDSEENYSSLKDNDYKGKGLLATITADHSKETPVVKLKHYQIIQVPELKERKIGDNEDPFAEDDGNIDAFDYDVQNAVVQGDKMTLDIVATGKVQDIAEFIIGYIQVQRDLTPATKTYALNIYDNSESLKAKSPKYQFDGETLTYEEVLSALKK